MKHKNNSLWWSIILFLGIVIIVSVKEFVRAILGDYLFLTSLIGELSVYIIAFLFSIFGIYRAYERIKKK